MPLTSALTALLGQIASTKLINALTRKQNGPQKLTAAAEAVEKGATAMEALKGVFGDDLPKALAEAMGAGGSSFSYEAGTADYIKADTDSPHPPLKVLRDELNINLDRINFIDTKNRKGVKNYFRGMLHVWHQRFQALAPEHHDADAKATFAAIEKLLDDEDKSFKDVYRLVSATGIGGVGTLMVISGVFVAMGTGVGLATAISTFVFGIPWMTVGALVLPGALLIGLAAIKVTEDQAMTTCVQLAYKLIERCMAAEVSRDEPQPTTQREQ